MMHAQVQSACVRKWIPVSMGAIPRPADPVEIEPASKPLASVAEREIVADEIAEIRVELTAKGQELLDGFRCVVPKRRTRYGADEFWDIGRFEIDSLDELSDADWREVHRRVHGHTERMLADYGLDLSTAKSIACSAIAAVRASQVKWQRSGEPNLLQYLFDKVRSKAAGDAGRLKGTRASEPEASLAGIEMRASFDVNDVIQHLPTIALLVSRLNDLLNPVGNPSKGGVQ